MPWCGFLWSPGGAFPTQQKDKSFICVKTCYTSDSTEPLETKMMPPITQSAMHQTPKESSTTTMMPRSVWEVAGEVPAGRPWVAHWNTDGGVCWLTGRSCMAHSPAVRSRALSGRQLSLVFHSSHKRQKKIILPKNAAVICRITKQWFLPVKHIPNFKSLLFSN